MFEDHGHGGRGDVKSFDIVIYHLDRSGGIKDSDLVQAWNDADALRKANGLALDHEIEVWDRTRFVGLTGNVSSGRVGRSAELIAAPL